MEEFTAFIVDDDQSIRDVTVRLLSYVGIHARAYSTAEELRARLFPSALLEPLDMPDLIVVDLQLQPHHMQGTDLIRELADRDIPSEIMAISGVVPSSEFADDIICFGAAVLLPKPFGGDEFCQRALALARIGKKRRMRRAENRESRLQLKDRSRKHRPVFISYAHEDTMEATGIRRNIESFSIDVWYAPTALEVGHKHVQEIKDGIDDACIFIPLLSDHFLASKDCLRELHRFLSRIDREQEGHLLLLPVLADLSSQGESHELFRSIADTYQYIKLRPRTSDCLTALILRIQEHLKKREHNNNC